MYDLSTLVITVFMFPSTVLATNTLELGSQ